RLFWSAHEGQRVTAKQWATGLLIVPFAWLIVAFWEPLARVRARFRWQEVPREGDLLILLGTITLPLLAALVTIPAERLNGGPLTGDLEWRVRIITVGFSMIAAAWVGTGWRAGWWLVLAGTFLAVTVPLYTTFGTNPRGIWGLPWNSLNYWLEQHTVQRGNQPPFYYLMMLPLYEILVLAPAAATAAWLIARRRDAFAIFAGWWFLGSLVAFSYAGEKMPWLTVHLTIPLAVLAAYGLGRALPAAARAVRAGRGHPLAWAGTGLAAAAMLLLVAYTVDADVGLNKRHPDTAVEPLIYVQTTPQVPPLAADIRQRLKDGRAKQVYVDNTDSLTWPWAWYLRGLAVRYADAEFFRQGNLEPDAVYVVARGTLDELAPVRRQYEPSRYYIHRWWFVEDGYRATTWRNFASGLRDGSLPRRWLEFARHRSSPDTLGILEGEVLFPRTAAPTP
ncbi:MAG: TIGR03663 family protein, partial [Dehalococcoidia bacterium]